MPFGSEKAESAQSLTAPCTVTKNLSKLLNVIRHLKKLRKW